MDMSSIVHHHYYYLLFNYLYTFIFVLYLLLNYITIYVPILYKIYIYSIYIIRHICSVFCNNFPICLIFVWHNIYHSTELFTQIFLIHLRLFFPLFPVFLGISFSFFLIPLVIYLLIIFYCIIIIVIELSQQLSAYFLLKVRREYFLTAGRKMFVVTNNSWERKTFPEKWKAM